MKLIRGAIPLYYQIAQILRSQIHSQEYKPKDMLPTEDEMIRTFGVSRTTVRQAFQTLLNEGLISRIPGKGTFVDPDARTPHGDWPIIQSLDQIIACGYMTKLKLLGYKTIQANEGLAKILQIPPASDVSEIRGIRFVDDRPFYHITLHVPSDIATKIPMEQAEEKPIFVLIEEYCGLRIKELLQWTSASLAGSEVARHLKLNVGDPVLLAERHFIDMNGRVVEAAIDRYRTDSKRHFLRWTRQGHSIAGPIGREEGKSVEPPLPAKTVGQ
jgi:GntR family transcriptional regulator